MAQGQKRKTCSNLFGKCSLQDQEYSVDQVGEAWRCLDIAVARRETKILDTSGLIITYDYKWLTWRSDEFEFVL